MIRIQFTIRDLDIPYILSVLMTVYHSLVIKISEGEREGDSSKGLNYRILRSSWLITTYV